MVTFLPTTGAKVGLFVGYIVRHNDDVDGSAYWLEGESLREQTIINALQTNGPMSVAALAATLGVSRRTLQSDLRQLNEDNTGFIITVTRNVGYQLTITDSAQFAA